MTKAQLITKARELYQYDGGIEIDHDAKISRSKEGAYVQAWVWVPNEDD